jgi:hypothetical protein
MLEHYQERIELSKLLKSLKDISASCSADPGWALSTLCS